MKLEDFVEIKSPWMSSFIYGGIGLVLGIVLMFVAVGVASRTGVFLRDLELLIPPVLSIVSGHFGYWRWVKLND